MCPLYPLFLALFQLNPIYLYGLIPRCRLTLFLHIMLYRRISETPHHIHHLPNQSANDRNIKLIRRWLIRGTIRRGG
jgi:hypothetical protein